MTRDPLPGAERSDESIVPTEPFELGDILVVDDDPGNLLAIEAALGDIPHAVVRAHSGEEALRKLLAQDFALILLDVHMPSMNGLETAKLIRRRERSRSTPIIFVTGFARDDEQVLAGYSLGAVDFLFKPITPQVLRAKVAVFVELERRTAETVRQAELLRMHERREHERVLLEERHRWEQESLRAQMEEERRAAEELARKTDELERTVAERERAEQELARMNRELEAIDRRKDEFLAVLGHELRNPLAPLVNGLELLRLHLDEQPAPLAEPVRRTHEFMERQVEHLRRLVDDLLDVSRISRGKVELRVQPTDLREALSEAVSMSRAAVDQRRHRLVLDLDEQPVPVQGDPVRLTQVVANLLNNAIRYTEPGGRIELRCRGDGGEAVLEVSDDGCGIEADFLPRIFDFFEQERRGGEGLGLGLTLVHHLVTLHGGGVQAASDGLGRGSRFTIRLPLADSEARALPAASPVDDDEWAAPGGGGTLRVVVVEDHPEVRDSICALIRRWGHEVEAAADGEDGLATILRARPDVALVDLGMPRLDGYQMAEQVRRALTDDPPRLVAVSGFGSDEDRRRALACGFDAHLVKPASPGAIRRALDGEAARSSASGTKPEADAP